jgi:hypothetical protein
MSGEGRGKGGSPCSGFDRMVRPGDQDEADRSAQSTPTQSPHVLVTLETARKPYESVSVRTLREAIARGALPASKIGRCLMVSPADVAALFAPKLRRQPRRPQRETPNQRAERQLRAAGIVPRSEVQ